MTKCLVCWPICRQWTEWLSGVLEGVTGACTCTVCPQCTGYSVQGTVYSVQRTGYSVQRTVHTVQSSVYTVQSTMYLIQGKSKVYRVHRTLNPVPCTVNVTHCSVLWAWGSELKLLSKKCAVLICQTSSAGRCLVFGLSHVCKVLREFLSWHWNWKWIGRSETVISCKLEGQKLLSAADWLNRPLDCFHWEGHGC